LIRFDVDYQVDAIVPCPAVLQQGKEAATIIATAIPSLEQLLFRPGPLAAHDSPHSPPAAMVVLTDHSMRASLQVAPLAIQKSRSGSISNGLSQPEQNLSNNLYSQSQMTPPTTPNGSQEDLTPQPAPPPVFHNFLRAFYPFHPSYAMTDSSVTLPLNEGDVILVHSIHTNGWADGTLLVSGARGWLPTNYCEAYDPEEMRNLLKALLNFWDLLRSTSVNDSEIFGNQEFMKGIIAGVRFLLVRSACCLNCLSALSTNTLKRSEHIA
jgi:hypothetical protein